MPFDIGVSSDQMAANALLFSLLFPTAYFFYDLLFKHRKNVIAVLGFISVVVTGVVGFLQLSSEWIAIKDALIPLVVGFLILLSLKMRPPLLYRLICNDEIMNIDLVLCTLKENGNTRKFRKLFTNTTVLFFWSFVLSAVLHYVLAEIVLVDDMPSNKQLGELMYLKYPYCVVPFAVFIILIVLYFFHGLKHITGLTLDEMFPEKENNSLSKKTCAKIERKEDLS